MSDPIKDHISTLLNENNANTPSMDEQSLAQFQELLKRISSVMELLNMEGFDQKWNQQAASIGRTYNDFYDLYDAIQIAENYLERIIKK